MRKILFDAVEYNPQVKPNYLDFLTSLDEPTLESYFFKNEIDPELVEEAYEMPEIKENTFTYNIIPIKFDKTEGLSSDLLGFLQICQTVPELANRIKVTSGYRAGAKTKQGKTSHHSTGNAIDIVPKYGTYNDLKEIIANSPQVVDYMISHGIGIFEETTPEVKRKTGATGDHWHIGKDSTAKIGLLNILKQYRHI